MRLGPDSTHCCGGPEAHLDSTVITSKVDAIWRLGIHDVLLVNDQWAILFLLLLDLLSWSVRHTGGSCGIW